MPSNNYSNGLLEIQRQTINFVTDDIQALVVGSGFSFNKGHTFVSEISGEVSGTGYERKSLTNKSISLSTGSPDKIQFNADELIYTDVDVSPDDFTSVVIFKQVTGDADSRLLCVVDIPNISTNGTTITVRFDGNVVMEAENPIAV